jgi:hypothetical protein
MLYHRVSLILSKISGDDTSIETRQEERSTQDPSGWFMSPWTFSVKFSYDTQFIFGSLMFTVWKDENLALLTQGPVQRHPAPVYGKAPYYSVDPSTSGRACSALNPHEGLYYLSTMTSQGRTIGKTIFRSSAGTSSSSSSGATPDRDSIEDYPEIGVSAC